MDLSLSLGIRRRVSVSGLPSPTGLAWFYDFLEGVDDQVLVNKAAGLGSTHDDAAVDFTLGLTSSAAADDPTWVTDPGSQDVGLNYDGDDLCERVSQLNLTGGDFALGVCFLSTGTGGVTIQTGNSINELVYFISATSLQIRIDGSARNFTIPALDTTKYHRLLLRRVGTALSLLLDGTLTVHGKTVATGDYSFDRIAARDDGGGPTDFLTGNVCDLFGNEGTFTDDQFNQMNDDMLTRVKRLHGLVDGDFA